MSTLELFESKARFELKERYKSLSHDSMQGGLDITHTHIHTQWSCLSSHSLGY